MKLLEYFKPLKFAWNNPEWDKILIDAIKSSELVKVKPKDWADYIDRYPWTQKGRVRFWGNVMVEMARQESNWNPKLEYTEKFKDRFGWNVVSTGLFQLSVESLRGYKIFLTHEQDLHPAIINIECAVAVLSKWVSQDRVISEFDIIWLGGARYWSTLRHTNKNFEQIKKANR